MKNRMKDLAVITGAAALTALVATFLLAPEITIAEDDKLMTMYVGAPGSLVVDGLTFTVEAGETVQKPGAKPVLVLTATSSSKKTQTVGVDIELTSMRSPNFISRAMPMPIPVFTKRIEAKVAPGKSRTIEIATDFATKAGTVLGVNLTAGEKKVHVAGFSVKKAEPVETYTVEKKNP